MPCVYLDGLEPFFGLPIYVFVLLPGRAWYRPEDSVHVRAYPPSLQLGLFPLPVRPLHALRFSGWLGTVEVPPLPPS